jgi:ribosomal protein L7/L12
MLNVKSLFSILSNSEKAAMSTLCRRWENAEAVEAARKIKLVDTEKQTATLGQKIIAIKAVRERTGKSLLICKYAVEDYLQAYSQK